MIIEICIKIRKITMTTENISNEDLTEIIEIAINLKNSLSILCDYCLYNESNHKLMSMLCLLEILTGECNKILDKF